MAQHGPAQLVYGQSTSRHDPRLPSSGLRPTNLRHLIVCSPDEPAQAEVQRDCHVVFAGSYYSAPHVYVGRKVDLYVYERVVQLYDGVNLLVTHQRATRKGQRFTLTEHYPTEKALYLTRTPAVCRELSEGIGPFCAEVVIHLFSVNRPTTNLRAAQALLRLCETYGKDRLEAANWKLEDGRWKLDSESNFPPPTSIVQFAHLPACPARRGVI